MIINKEIIRFILTGITNTIFYYLLYSFFIYMKFDYKISVLLATIIGVFFSFKTFGKFVFDNEDKTLLFKFLSVYILLYFINISIISILNTYNINLYIAGLFATFCCTVLSFILNKWYVFIK